MCVYEKYVEDIQELMDMGYSKMKIAKELGVCRKKVARAISRYGLEEYVAFDEYLYKIEEITLDEEGVTDSLILSVLDKDLIIPGSNKRDNDWFIASNFIKRKYGNLINYLHKKDFKHFINCIYMECDNCRDVVSIETDVALNQKQFLGLDGRCKGCIATYVSHWQKENKEKTQVNLQRRRARKRELPDNWTDDQKGGTWQVFNNKCSLTGSEINLEIEHSIPLTTGHGGTTSGNVYPMLLNLNRSKNDSNLFEWFEANRQRFEIPQSKFDSLIEWLASANALTVKEYREFYDWCFANPREFDAIKADQRHSIEIWRESVGKQFPLPAYTETYRMNDEVKEAI